MKVYKIGSILARHRVKSGLTQRQLGHALGYSTSQLVSNWERGLCPVPLKKFNKLSKILRISKEELAELLIKDFKSEVSKTMKLSF